jgi:glycosyltransferase involved in cell wall biosynthesis
VADGKPNEHSVVDIGMPAYRRPELIGGAIESVLRQSYSNWRLVVSENGPGGGAVEDAVRPYTADERISYVATGSNLGPAANWTGLLQAGTAKYFTVIQDDDAWDPGFLDARVRFLDQHPSCGYVFSGERMMDHDGQEIAVERTRALAAKDVSDVLEEGVYAPEELVPAMYRHRLGGIHTPSISSGGVMSRRSALEAVGPYFDDSLAFLFWDVELYMRMSIAFPTGFLAVRDVAQRIHVTDNTRHESVTSESTFDGERWVRYHEYHRDWFQRALPEVRLPRQFGRIRAQAFIIAALDAIESGDRSRCAEHLRGAVAADPLAAFNPRLAVCAFGLLLGERGSRIVRGVRNSARRRNQTLAYEPADVGG